ncbi:MAG TPA: hypothetical protein VF238_11065 [Methylomirabilota bacterium]
MSPEQDQAPSDVSFARLVLLLTRNLSDKALMWTAIGLSAGVVGVVMFKPMPWWCVVVASGFIGLLSPLWLMKEKE